MVLFIMILLSKVSHFGSLPVFMHTFHDHFEIASSGCVCTEYRAILNISESLDQKVTGI